MELSQKLKELRKKQGLTQLELAERLFVSRQAISGWEAGTSRPSTENLQSLSRLFNIPLETLLDDSAEAEPAAAQEKLPAEEQAKEEDKGQGKGAAGGPEPPGRNTGRLPGPCRTGSGGSPGGGPPPGPGPAGLSGPGTGGRPRCVPREAGRGGGRRSSR